MASQLANEDCCAKHRLGVDEKIALRGHIREDDWAAERTMIASNAESCEKLDLYITIFR